MKYILTTLLIGAAALHAAAYDFMAGGLAYNINPDGKTVTLTYTSFGNNYPGVTAITVPEQVTASRRTYTVTAVGGYALYECGDLTTLTLPATVTEVGEYAAQGSEKLVSVQMMESNVATIGRYAFSETGLTDVALPASVVSVGDYAFADCRDMVNADLGNGVTTIGRFAFSRCTALTTASLGANVVEIYGSAFAGCYMLRTLNCAMPEPPGIDASVFSGVNTGECLLRVPRNAKQLYANAPVWCTFKFAADEVGYTITATDITHLRGTGGCRLSVALNNEHEVSAVELKVQLPKGTAVVMKGEDADVQLNAQRRTRDHNVRLTNSGTTVRIVISSLTGKALKGDSGELFDMGLTFDEPDLSTDTIKFEEIRVSTPDGELAYLPDATATLTLQYLRGDADGDASVDVADYIVAANRLAGHPNATDYFLDAADTNRNGFLDVADLLGITQRALRTIEPEVVTQLPKE